MAFDATLPSPTAEKADDALGFWLTFVTLIATIIGGLALLWPLTAAK